MMDKSEKPLDLTDRLRIIQSMKNFILVNVLTTPKRKKNDGEEVIPASAVQELKETLTETAQEAIATVQDLKKTLNSQL
jgi:hypothetical protein